MASDIKPLGELELWNRPGAGQVAPWVRAVVALGALLGVVVVAAAATTLWHVLHVGERVDDQFVALPTFLMLTTVLVVTLPDGTLSRFVRLAVALPPIHALALAVGTIAVLGDIPASLIERTPLLEALPVLPAFALGLAGFGVLGVAIGRREWAHALVMLALAYVLLLGLWLPIAAVVPVRTDELGLHATVTRELLREQPAGVACFALIPPALLAIAYTVLAVRMPEHARRLRVPIAAAVAVVFGISVVSRVTANHGAFTVHDNFIHLLLVAIAIAIVATLTLAVSTWSVGRRAVRDLARGELRAGRVTDDDSEVVACMQITSWLRGPRLWMRSFVANTASELVSVPGGAALATSVPRISTAIRTGEAVVVLGKRDPIVLGGLVERAVGDSPFRATTVMVPGPTGITVGRAEPVSTPLESMLLTAWRPAVAYLLILLVVAVPSLLGLVVKGEP